MSEGPGSQPVPPDSPGPGAARIDTPRLRLDPLRVADANEMVEVLADPDLYAFTGGEPPTLETLRARYEAQVSGGPADGSERWLNWVIRLRDEGDAIGYAQATVTGEGREADVAWVLGTPWQGHGYATEAATAVLHALAAEGVRVITAHVNPDHLASAAVARRLGLERTQDVEDGEVVWRLDVGAREDAKRRRSVRLNLAVGVALVAFGVFELVMARTGRLPRSGDQLLRDLLLMGAGVAMLGYAVRVWVALRGARRRR